MTSLFYCPLHKYRINSNKNIFPDISINWINLPIRQSIFQASARWRFTCHNSIAWWQYRDQVVMKYTCNSTECSTFVSTTGKSLCNFEICRFHFRVLQHSYSTDNFLQTGECSVQARNVTNTSLYNTGTMSTTSIASVLGFFSLHI